MEESDDLRDGFAWLVALWKNSRGRTPRQRHLQFTIRSVHFSRFCIIIGDFYILKQKCYVLIKLINYIN
jgi:hypothetical protein